MNTIDRIHKQSKRRRLSINLNADVLQKLIARPCHYCGGNENVRLDRIDSNCNTYSLESAVPCCRNCNYAKNILSINTFLRQIQAIYLYQQTHVWQGVPVYTSRNPSYGRFCREARERNLRNELSETEWRLLLANNCVYCGFPRANGIDRMDNGRGYEQDNVQSCCWTCNQMKHVQSYSQFLSMINAIISHIFFS